MTIVPMSEAAGNPPATEPADALTPVFAYPRVDLLPKEVASQNRSRQIQAWIRIGMLVVLAAALLVCFLVWQATNEAKRAGEAAQSETLRLQTQLAGYAPLRNALAAVELDEAAIVVGGALEVDWQAYLGEVRATLPEGTVIESYSVQSPNISGSVDQSSVPFEGARIATLSFTAHSGSLPQVPEWLDRLATLPGFVDVTPGAINANEDRGGYDLSMTLHVDASVYSLRVLETKVAQLREAAAAANQVPETTDTTEEGGAQ